MKSIITNVFIFLFVCGAIDNTFSQTEAQRRVITKNYDNDALAQLAARLEAEYKTNYNRALILAKQNNWPIHIQKEDGGSSALQGVSDQGAPLYYTTSNEASSITSRTNQVQPNGNLGLDLTGVDMYAGVWEDTKPIEHDDFVGRLFNYDGSNGTNAVGFHSTHVVGTIIGNGDHNAKGKGMATDAWAWTNNWDNDLGEMALTAKAGMLVSNHSYGLIAEELDLSYFGAYMKSSKDLDEVLYNAPYYQAVMAAGNDRDDGVNPTKQGYDLLTKYNTAKNAIVVAAVREVLNYTGPQSVTMSSFSNWGPTDDNRIKPDIAAQGVNVLSTDNNPSKTGYSYSDGTSMAAPGVTGSLLLLQQHFANLYGDFMYSSTLRGLMVHTASEAGSYPGPDSKFGWGLMNTGAAANLITESVEGSDQFVISELTLNQGIVYTKNITISGDEPLVATIDWTDIPGKAVNSEVDSEVPVLVNDLDIRITKDNTTYYPWKLGPGLSDPAIKGDNSVDNVEKIEILNPEAGTYTITVSNKGTLVANKSGELKQNFSLIISGGTTLNTNDTVFKTFNVWPNPINDKLNVSIQSVVSDDVFVTIYDIQGKRIINEKLNFSNDFFNGSINVDALNPGIYLVKILQGNKQSFRKIIKK